MVRGKENIQGPTGLTVRATATRGCPRLLVPRWVAGVAGRRGFCTTHPSQGAPAGQSARAELRREEKRVAAGDASMRLAGLGLGAGVRRVGA